MTASIKQKSTKYKEIESDAFTKIALHWPNILCRIWSKIQHVWNRLDNSNMTKLTYQKKAKDHYDFNGHNHPC